MNKLLQYTGVLIVLLGALALIIPALTNSESNTTLIIGGALLVVGFIAHLILFRIGMDEKSSK